MIKRETVYRVCLFAVLLLAACEKQNKENFTDSRDNKVYKYVTIEEQVWMAENLNYEAEGSLCYDNKPENCEKYGRLYNWKTAMTACPSGWHLPTLEEWHKLLGYAGGEYLKTKSGWNEDGNGEDKFGFSALPGGYGYQDSIFDNIGKYGSWWSSENDHLYADYIFMYYGDDSVSKRHEFKMNFQSVRCLKNDKDYMEVAAPTEKTIEKDSSNNFSGRIRKVFEPVEYRSLNRNEIPTGTLVGLFRNDSSYYFKSEKVMFDTGFDECSGDSTLRVVSVAEFLFVNFADYNKNKVKFAPLPVDTNLMSVRRKQMPPGEKFAFEFEGKQYELEAFGEGKYDLKNYSLSFSDGGNKQTILNIPSTQDAIPELLFIGDIDGDGKPDIILNAQYNYENRWIKVFLSSTAKEGELLKFEAERFDWFDC